MLLGVAHSSGDRTPAAPRLQQYSALTGLAAGLLTIAERCEAAERFLSRRMISNYFVDPVSMPNRIDQLRFHRQSRGSGAEDNLTGSLEMPMARRLGLADLMSYIDGRRIAPFGIARVLIVKEGP